MRLEIQSGQRDFPLVHHLHQDPDYHLLEDRQLEESPHKHQGHGYR
ncbi:hypothetical protein [Streptococcus thermophilus]|nr:hypothetical protein [Streptococcus thermophilus]